jgi:hypothetical protein
MREAEERDRDPRVGLLLQQATAAASSGGDGAGEGAEAAKRHLMAALELDPDCYQARRHACPARSLARARKKNQRHRGEEALPPCSFH